jgi:hypothetical protein
MNRKEEGEDVSFTALCDDENGEMMDDRRPVKRR